MSRESEDLVFRDCRLPEEPSPDDLRAAAADYEAICLANIRAVVERFERHGGAYPFVDTKLDLRTGRDHPAGDLVRGRGTIYGWIQGRGLEAVAGHALWAEADPRRPLQELAPRLRAMAAAVLDSVRRLRARNEGHLFFFMSPDGSPFAIGPGGPPRAGGDHRRHAERLQRPLRRQGPLRRRPPPRGSAAEAEAAEWMGRVSADIWSRRFASDQQPLDPTNPIETLPGRHGHGPYMIQLGAAALGPGPGSPAPPRTGSAWSGHVLDNHANLDGRPALRRATSGSSSTTRGSPCSTRAAILSDPGHALEFVGLAFKLLGEAGSRPGAAGLTADLFRVMDQVFGYGFQPGPGGICKAYDLVARRPIHTDMPWWSLPETIRTAALAWRALDDEEARRRCLRIWAACHNAFFEHFLRPEVHLMAVQMRAADGSVSPAIPATADADPGYHTGLSLLDVVEAVRSAP